LDGLCGVHVDVATKRPAKVDVAQPVPRANAGRETIGDGKSIQKEQQYLAP
jgi:hypothetical protein